MRKGATRPRTPSPAHEGDGRHQKRRPEGKRDSTGHMGTMWSSPLCRNEASQVVGWQCKKSLPCCRRSSQPRLDLRLQARGGSAGVRPFRRARSARAIGRPRSHEDALVSLRSATLCKFVGGASARGTTYVVGLTLPPTLETGARGGRRERREEMRMEPVQAHRPRRSVTQRRIWHAAARRGRRRG